PYSHITYMYAGVEFLKTDGTERCSCWGECSCSDCSCSDPRTAWFPNPHKMTKMLEFNAIWFTRPEAYGYGDLPGRLHGSEMFDEICHYDSVFLGHAAVFVFADKYGIQDLMDYAIIRLTRALGCWVIYKATFVSDFGLLVQYVYDNSLPGS